MLRVKPRPAVGTRFGRLTDGTGRVWWAGGKLYHTGQVPAMSSLSLANPVAHLPSHPILVGYLVVAGLVTTVKDLEYKRALQGEKLAELWR